MWKKLLGNSTAGNRLCLGIKFIVRGRSRMTSLPSALHLLMFPFLSGAFPLAPSLCLLSCVLFVLSSSMFNLSLLLESFLGVRVGGLFLRAALAKRTCSAGFTSLSLIRLHNPSRMLSSHPDALTHHSPSFRIHLTACTVLSMWFFILIHCPRALESLDMFVSARFVFIIVLLRIYMGWNQ